MNICPFPNCGHVFEVFTKNHCETVHQMTRDKLLKKYGPYKPFRVDNNAYKQNMKMLNVITQGQFCR
jgi:hypothetical protein